MNRLQNGRKAGLIRSSSTPAKRIRGEHFGPHESLEQKIEHARAFRDQFDIRRPIVVDDLEGTGHRAFGMLPNMTYILSCTGRVLFRSDWTDPPTIESAIDYLHRSRARRRDGTRLKPFYAEMVGYRWTDYDAFQQGLSLAGPQAVSDFAEAMERWSSGAPIKGGLTIDES